MFAWIEAGRSNTFQAIGAKDVVFRTASTSNNIVLGNASNSQGAACAYIHENRLGVNRIPMVGANLDVRGNAAVSRGLSIYDDAVHASNFNLLAPSCAHVTHSNICITPLIASGPAFYADASGYARAHHTVASARNTVTSALSNLTIRSVSIDEDNDDQVTIDIVDDFRGPEFDAMCKGAQIVIGNTQYRVVDVQGSAASTHSLRLESSSPSLAPTRRDDSIGAGSNVVVEVLRDAHRQLVDTAVWPQLRLNACFYEPRSQGHVMRVYCEDDTHAATRAYQDMRSSVGEFLALSTLANVSSGRSIVVRVVGVSEAFDDGFYFDACAPDMSAFGDAATQYMQWTNGGTLVARPLSPADDGAAIAERALQSVAVSRASDTSLEIVIADEDDALWLHPRLLPATVSDAAGGIVRIALATTTGETLRGDIVRSSFDLDTMTLHVEFSGRTRIDDFFAAFGASTPDLQGCSLLVRIVGQLVEIASHQLVDVSKSTLVLENPPPTVVQRLGELAGSVDGFAYVSGLSSSALLHRVVSFDPDAASLVLRPWSYQPASSILAPNSRATLLLLKPSLQSALADPSAPALSLPLGVRIGDVHMASGSGYMGLTVAGGARVERTVSIVDAASSTMSGEMTFSSNVLSIGHVPGSMYGERAPLQATQAPGIDISSSNVRVNYPLIVDGQVTAKNVRTTSDVRLKKNVVDTQSEEDLSNLLSIEVKRFHFVDEADDAGKHVGVIAQSVEPIVPSAVGRASGVIPFKRPIACTPTSDRHGARIVGLEHDGDSMEDDLKHLKPGVTVKWRHSQHPFEEGCAAIASVHRHPDGHVRLGFSAPLDITSCDGKLALFAIVDDIHVIDTTELLCMTMSAVKIMHQELSALKMMLKQMKLPATPAIAGADQYPSTLPQTLLPS